MIFGRILSVLHEFKDILPYTKHIYVLNFAHIFRIYQNPSKHFPAVLVVPVNR